jgi:uncharacterized protein
MSDVSVIWRRIDQPGHDACRLAQRGQRWHLAGAAVFVTGGDPCRLDYVVECGPDWRTLRSRVTGWIGARLVESAIEADGGRWRLEGADCPAVAGCIDLDLNFTPSTNLLAIRRLDLAVGSEAPARAAWLRFPSFTLEPLDQIYRRTGEMTYRYESGGGSFAVDLKVDPSGFVIDYPGFWQAHQLQSSW